MLNLNNLSINKFENYENVIIKNHTEITLILIQNVLNQLINNEIPYEIYNETIETYQNVSSSISSLFFTEICLTLRPNHCLTPFDVINDLMNENYQNSISEILFVLFKFSYDSFIKFYLPSINEILSMNFNILPTYYLCIIIENILIFFLGIFFAYNFYIGINSLFHYQKYTQKVDRNKLHKKSKLPSNILVIKTLKKNDKIYSISKNCKKLINADYFDLIGKKFFNIFQIVYSDDNFEVVSYQFDALHKEFYYKKQNFQSNSKNNLELNYITLIPKIENAPKIDSKLNLVSYMPKNFALKFKKDFQNIFTYLNCCIIIIKTDSKQFKRFFHTLCGKLFNFSSIEIIRFDGKMIYFITKKDFHYDALILIYKLITDRDLESCIVSAYIDYFKEIELIVETKNEPYLSINGKAIKTMIKNAYLTNPKSIMFSNKALKKFKILNNMQNSLWLHNETSTYFLLFDVFKEQLFKYL